MELQTVFYIAGGVLVVAALLVSFIGIRGKDSFPPSRGVMSAGIAVFLLLVAGTAAYAVASAREEQEHRETEQADEEAEAAEEVADAEGQAPEGGKPSPVRRAAPRPASPPVGLPRAWT